MRAYPPRAELANRWFRYGAYSGAVSGFTLLATASVSALVEFHRQVASPELEGGPDILVLVFYTMSYPALIALCLAGTVACAMLFGALGIVAARIVYRTRPRRIGAPSP